MTPSSTAQWAPNKPPTVSTRAGSGHSEWAPEFVLSLAGRAHNASLWSLKDNTIGRGHMLSLYIMTARLSCLFHDWLLCWPKVQENIIHTSCLWVSERLDIFVGGLLMAKMSWKKIVNIWITSGFGWRIALFAVVWMRSIYFQNSHPPNHQTAVD